MTIAKVDYELSYEGLAGFFNKKRVASSKRSRLFLFNEEENKGNIHDYYVEKISDYESKIKDELNELFKERGFVNLGGTIFKSEVEGYIENLTVHIWDYEDFKDTDLLMFSRFKEDE